jgi:hypothetical protein
MTGSHMDPVLVVVLALAGLGMLAAFRSGARGVYKVARHSQEVTRMGEQPGPGPGHHRGDRRHPVGGSEFHY